MVDLQYASRSDLLDLYVMHDTYTNILLGIYTDMWIQAIVHIRDAYPGSVTDDPEWQYHANAASVCRVVLLGL